MANDKLSHGPSDRWDRRKRDIGVVVWISFLAACAGTFVIFAVLDPAALTNAWVLPWEMGRKLAYSLGFAFLFCVGGLASALTAFMLRTGPRQREGDDPAAGNNHSATDAEDPHQELVNPGDWR